MEFIYLFNTFNSRKKEKKREFKFELPLSPIESWKERFEKNIHPHKKNFQRNSARKKQRGKLHTREKNLKT